VLDSIETYATNQFSPVGDGASPTKLTGARTAALGTLVTLVNGTSRVIIAGGVVRSPTAVLREIFDPASGTIISEPTCSRRAQSHSDGIAACSDARPQCWREGGETPALGWVYGPLRGRQAGTGLLILSPRMREERGRGTSVGRESTNRKLLAPRHARLRSGANFAPSPSIWGLPIDAMARARVRRHLLCAKDHEPLVANEREVFI